MFVWQDPSAAAHFVKGAARPAPSFTYHGLFLTPGRYARQGGSFIALAPGVAVPADHVEVYADAPGTAVTAAGRMMIVATIIAVGCLLVWGGSALSSASADEPVLISVVTPAPELAPAPIVTPFEEGGEANGVELDLGELLESEPLSVVTVPPEGASDEPPFSVEYIELATEDVPVTKADLDELVDQVYKMHQDVHLMREADAAAKAEAEVAPEAADAEVEAELADAEPELRDEELVDSSFDGEGLVSIDLDDCKAKGYTPEGVKVRYKDGPCTVTIPAAAAPAG